MRVLSLFVLSIAALVAVPRVVEAQALPTGLPQIDAINASIQAGSIAPSRYGTVPDANVDEGDLWGFGVESEFHLPVAEDSDWSATLGVGYNQLNLDATIGANRRLRGTLRDLPALSLYFGRGGEWYAGLTIAVSELANGRIHSDPAPGAIDPGPIKVSSSAFSAGLSIGFEYRHAFVELGYMMRYFPSLAYDAIPSSGFPSDLGERMYAGGVVLRVGGTLGLKSQKPSKRTIVCDRTSVELTDIPGSPHDYECTEGNLVIPAPRPSEPPASK